MSGTLTVSFVRKMPINRIIVPWIPDSAKRILVLINLIHNYVATWCRLEPEFDSLARAFSLSFSFYLRMNPRRVAPAVGSDTAASGVLETCFKLSLIRDTSKSLGLALGQCELTIRHDQ